MLLWAPGEQSRCTGQAVHWAWGGRPATWGQAECPTGRRAPAQLRISYDLGEQGPLCAKELTNPTFRVGLGGGLGSAWGCKETPGVHSHVGVRVRGSPPCHPPSLAPQPLAKGSGVRGDSLGCKSISGLHFAPPPSLEFLGRSLRLPRSLESPGSAPDTPWEGWKSEGSLVPPPPTHTHPRSRIPGRCKDHTANQVFLGQGDMRPCPPWGCR